MLDGLGMFGCGAKNYNMYCKMYVSYQGTLYHVLRYLQKEEAMRQCAVVVLVLSKPDLQ